MKYKMPHDSVAGYLNILCDVDTREECADFGGSLPLPNSLKRTSGAPSE